METFCFASITKKLLEVLNDFVEKEEDTIKEIENVFSSFGGNEIEKKSAFDQAARDYLKTFLKTEIYKNAEKEKDSTNDIESRNDNFRLILEKFISLLIKLSKARYCTNNIAILLLSDVFETLTLDDCEKLFKFVEEHVQTWTSEPFFSTGKNHLLRMCNDMLRRLSKSQNTVFCGRIQLFLAQLFPLEEKSALNLNSIFHIENTTIYKKSSSTEFSGEFSTEGEEEGEVVVSTPVDYNLYIKFWSLQDFFRNPPQTYSNAGWKKLSTGIEEVLNVFESQKLEFNQKKRKSSVVIEDSENMDVTESYESVHNYFAKYLTNEKLLNLQINDSSFRRYFLVQVLILFQYLNGTVKFKTNQQVLTESQSSWLKELTEKIYSMLADTPPNGKKFASSLKHILLREENWINWKNDSCPSFAKFPQKGDKGKEITKKTKVPKRSIGDEYIHNFAAKRINMGTQELTRLWNFNPENLDACKDENRLKFLPTIEDFFEEAIEQMDPEAGIEEQYKLVKKSNFQWRALRLIARRSHHFFTPGIQPFKALPEYLSCVIGNIAKDKQKAMSDIKTEMKIEIKEEPEDEVITTT